MLFFVSKIHPWVIVSGDITLEKIGNIGGRLICKPLIQKYFTIRSGYLVFV